MSWTKRLFRDNLQRLYRYTLPNVKFKESRCGNGEFLVVIISDENPKYEKRKTPNGMELVNSKIYDLKAKYREWLEQFAVHGTLTDIETNHNLTMLFGKNTKDFEEQLPEKWNREIEKIQRDLMGSNGWRDLKELFYVMNGTLNYVILRNFETLPESIPEDHADIDILTNDIRLLSHITNAESSPKNNKIAPLIRVGEKSLILDCRWVGDQYFDESWEKDVLKRKEKHNGIYVPCKEDHFFTLLYHAVIHREDLSIEYKDRLRSIGEELQIEDIDNILSNKKSSKKFLEDYMTKNRYKHTTSVSYVVKHNEIIRLYRTAVFIIKYQGWKKLFKEFNEKLKRVLSVN